jgi:hypothetical protein
MARELDERDLSRLDAHRDAASSASEASDLYSSEHSGRPVEDGPYSGSDEPVRFADSAASVGVIGQGSIDAFTSRRQPGQLGDGGPCVLTARASPRQQLGIRQCASGVDGSLAGQRAALSMPERAEAGTWAA